MADMPNEFWSGWIILLTSLSFIGLGWIVISVYLLPRKEIGQHKEPVWDGDLREGNNPLPFWWFWLILSAMIFSVIYLMLYPGLGTFSGALRWSQHGELEENTQKFDTQFSNINAEIGSASITQLQARPEVMKAAQNLFNQNCSACHGYQAQGQANLFPNLMDNEWQWGNTPEQIEQSIRDGRKAVMMSWQAMLNDDGVEKLSDYVLTGLGTEQAADHPGHIQYNQLCVACHGADGQGNPIMGAPDLTNDVWLYGGSKESIQESIGKGRSGEMPAFNKRLNDAQIKMLVAWLSKKSP